MNAIHFKRALRSKCSTTNFNTQIDIIFIIENFDNYISDTYESFFSDHKPIFIVLKPLIMSSNDEFIQYEKQNALKTIMPSKDKFIDDKSLINLENKRKMIEIDNSNIGDDKNLQTFNRLNRIKSIILDDKCIKAFIDVVNAKSRRFEMIDTILINAIQFIQPTTSQDIQIINSEKYLHWRCLYYDSFNLFIYDSLYANKHTFKDLDKKEKQFIKKRYPTLNEKENIFFPKVQQQLDYTSCGVFSTAFTISKIFDKDPTVTTYANDPFILRNHLMKIIMKNELIEFPSN